MNNNRIRLESMADLKFAKVLYDYNGQNDEEMTANKGDMVMIIDDSNNWWKVENQHGKIGILPSNYLQKKIVKKNSLIYHFYKIKGFNVSFVENTNSEKNAEVFIAKYNYLANGKNELSFNRGDQIEVTCKKSNDWWVGTVNGKTGKFPSNHVRPNTTTTLDNSNGYSHSEFLGTLPKPNDLANIKSKTTKCLSTYAIDNQKKPSTMRKQTSVDDDKKISKNNHMESEEGLNTTSELCSQIYEHDVTPTNDLVWYHGNLTRQMAENLLGQFNEPGRFLIRNSESKPNDFSLSVVGYDRIRHYKIICIGNVLKEDNDISEDGASCSIGDHSFPKIGTLIEFYKRNALLKTAEFCLFLTKPIPCMIEN